MRELTKEELDLAPSWATHYVITGNNYVMYESEYHWCTSEDFSRCCNSKVSHDAKPINRKPFDISEYEFSDKDLSISGICAKRLIEIKINDCGINSYGTLNKQDIIAIAKALGVTGEDL